MMTTTILEQKQTDLGSKVATARAEAQSLDLWKFSHLALLGYTRDRATLRRWIDNNGFPQPIVLSGNSIAWIASEVRTWFASRPRGASPQPRHRVPMSAAQRAKAGRPKGSQGKYGVALPSGQFVGPAWWDEQKQAERRAALEEELKVTRRTHDEA